MNQKEIHRSRAPLYKRRVSVEMNLTDLIIYCFPVHICATKKKRLKKQLWRRSENKQTIPIQSDIQNSLPIDFVRLILQVRGPS